MTVEGRRGTERSKNKWLDTIGNYVRATVGVRVGDVENSDKWRFRTRVVDPK